MLRNVKPEEWKWGTVDVTLDDGTEYKHCDFPHPLFSDTSPSIVSFWFENKLYNIPTDLIKSVIFNPPATPPV